jgi:beta-glucanase (GH16 family)
MSVSKQAPARVAVGTISLLVLVGLSILTGYLATHHGHAATSTLLFDDEFDGAAASAPDPTKWKVLGGPNPLRWGEECFVDDRSHVQLDGQGHLVETATYNPGGVSCTNGSGTYESGGVTTGYTSTNLFKFQYGTVEASIKVPCQSGTGLWPAWWSVGPNWPTGGELDYLEIMNPTTPADARQTIHGGTTSGSEWHIGYPNTSSSPWCNSFHTYGAIWSPGLVSFTVDGVVTHTTKPSDLQSGWNWPFDTYSEQLLLDLQVGSYGGSVTPSTLPQSMVTDWVRVYAYTSSPTPMPSPTASPTPTATFKVGDINGDGSVNVFDLSILLSKWGTNDPPSDINGDGSVNVFDLSALLSHWGT